MKYSIPTQQQKERPILSSAPMARAILDGRKTQTRRVIKPQPVEGVYKGDGITPTYSWKDRINTVRPIWPDVMAQFSPYGKAGDRLWVRETWQINHVNYDRGPIPKMAPADIRLPDDILYRADGEFSEQFEIDEGDSAWRPSIFMPRWASRITLEITDVRVERVQEITHRDALAEGVAYDLSKDGGAPVPQFQRLWDDINAKRGYGWDMNPWVWIVTFKLVQP